MSAARKPQSSDIEEGGRPDAVAVGTNSPGSTSPVLSVVPYRERAQEVEREFWNDAHEVGIDKAVWNLARAVAILEVEINEPDAEFCRQLIDGEL